MLRLAKAAVLGRVAYYTAQFSNHVTRTHI